MRSLTILGAAGILAIGSFWPISKEQRHAYLMTGMMETCVYDADALVELVAARDEIGEPVFMHWFEEMSAHYRQCGYPDNPPVEYISRNIEEWKKDDFASAAIYFHTQRAMQRSLEASRKLVP